MPAVIEKLIGAVEDDGAAQDFEKKFTKLAGEDKSLGVGRRIRFALRVSREQARGSRDRRRVDSVGRGSRINVRKQAPAGRLRYREEDGVRLGYEHDPLGDRRSEGIRIAAFNTLSDGPDNPKSRRNR